MRMLIKTFLISFGLLFGQTGEKLEYNSNEFDITEYWFTGSKCRYFLYDDGWESVLHNILFSEKDTLLLPDKNRHGIEMLWKHPAYPQGPVANYYVFDNSGNLFWVGSIFEPGAEYLKFWASPLFIGSVKTEFGKQYSTKVDNVIFSVAFLRNGNPNEIIMRYRFQFPELGGQLDYSLTLVKNVGPVSGFHFVVSDYSQNTFHSLMFVNDCLRE